MILKYTKVSTGSRRISQRPGQLFTSLNNIPRPSPFKIVIARFRNNSEGFEVVPTEAALELPGGDLRNVPFSYRPSLFLQRRGDRMFAPGAQRAASAQVGVLV